MGHQKHIYHDNKGRVCTKCKQYKLYSYFHKHKECINGYNTVCKSCRKPVSKKGWENTSLEKKIWNRAKTRATKKNIKFNIDIRDIVIPDICPVLKLTKFTPSIDRIKPNLGYTKGNIRIISNRANMLKNNATLEEIELILKDIKLLFMEEWRLIKKIKGLDLTQKVFETDDLPKSDKHEAQVDRFREELETMGHEVFEVKGHQFITDDGVYTIAHKSEIQYGGE